MTRSLLAMPQRTRQLDPLMLLQALGDGTAPQAAIDRQGPLSPHHPTPTISPAPSIPQTMEINRPTRRSLTATSQRVMDHFRACIHLGFQVAGAFSQNAEHNLTHAGGISFFAAPSLACWRVLAGAAGYGEPPLRAPVLARSGEPATPSGQA